MQPSKLGKLAILNMGQSPLSSSISDDDNGFPFLQGKAEFNSIYPKANLYCDRPLKICEKGDSLISVRAPVGALNRADQAYCIGRGLAAIRFNHVSPSLGWHLLCYWVKNLKTVAQGSTFEAISRVDLENLSVLYPLDDKEQQCIAQILDIFDTQIQQTKQLIAKLNHIKTGILQDLLTRGIDESGNVRDPVAHPEEFKKVFDGKLKIPFEWKVYPLAKVAELSSGVTLGRDLKGANTVELPYLRVANVQDGYLDLKEIKTIRVQKEEINRFLLQPGDVLMTEGGDFDKLGRGTVWTGEIPQCLHQNHIFKVRTNRHLLYPEFLALISRSSYGKQFFLLSSKQSTNLASINSTQLKAFPVPCPEKDEQERIINVVNTQNMRIATEEANLNKLQQIKKGLMHDLLTGQVRVTHLIEDEEPPSV